MLWDYLRQITAKDSKQSLSSVKDGDTKLTDPQDIANSLNIVLDNVTLDNVDSEKLLGVIVGKYLTWKHHVDKTAKTISKKHCPTF